MAQSHGDWKKELMEKKGQESSSIALQTPQKTESLARIEITSTEMYKDVLEYFDGMVCSIRLLKLCGKVATFENVRTQVEVLKKRKFLHRHLAQMKYVLPEEMQVNKLLVHDRRTLCMQPSVKISLSFTGMPLRGLFISRIVDFFTANQKVHDIPEAILPEPFCQGNEVIDQEFFNSNSGIQPQPTITDIEKPPASQLFTEFKRSFSKESNIHRSGSGCAAVLGHDGLNKEKTQNHQDNVDGITTEFDAANDKDNVDGMDTEPNAVYHENRRNERGEESISCVHGTSIFPPLEVARQTLVTASIALNSPTVKPSSSRVDSMVETPAQMTPKRSMSCCDSDEKSTSIQNIISSHKNAKRSLNFSSDEVGSHRNNLEESEKSFVIPDDGFQAPEPMKVKDTFGALAVLPLSQSKDKDNISKDPNDSEAQLRVSKQMPSCLPGIVSTIYHVYQMNSYSSITKEELVHKILVNDLEIVERKDAEDQIELLEKLVPDWIWRTSLMSAASEVIMYSISKETLMESVLSSLRNHHSF